MAVPQKEKFSQWNILELFYLLNVVQKRERFTLYLCAWTTHFLKDDDMFLKWPQFQHHYKPTKIANYGALSHKEKQNIFYKKAIILPKHFKFSNVLLHKLITTQHMHEEAENALENV